MFGIIKLTIHTITGMWVSIVLFKIDDEWLEWFLLSVLCTKPGIPDG